MRQITLINKFPLFLLLAGICMFALSCSSDDDAKDMTPPVISTEGIVANPINCQVYHRGETIPFNYLFSDDQELGSYNIEIHNNFDHHSHSTETLVAAPCGVRTRGTVHPVLWKVLLVLLCGNGREKWL